MLQTPVPDADSLRAVLDRVFAEPAYRWADRPGVLETIARWWRALIDWITGLETSSPVVYRLVLAGLVVVLAAILAHAGWVVLRTLRAGARGHDRAPPPAAATRRSADAHFAAADRLAAEGRFAEALREAFGGVLVRLDEAGALRLDPSRTPAECVRAARLAPEDRTRLRELVRRLYPVAFGGEPCGPEDYRRWRAAAALEWHATAG